MARRWTLLLGAAALAACTAQGPAPAPPDAGPPAHTVYVFGDSWHAGIVIARADLPRDGRLPETADFPRAAFLEFGWGDREYYPEPQPTAGMALRAALVPSPSVMHVAGFSEPPDRRHPDAEVLAVSLSTAAFDRLVTNIDAAFDRPEGGRAEVVARGLYPESHFYPAHGGFHLFNTCNTWVARQLAAAGVDLSPAGVMTANQLMRRLAGKPRVEQVKKRPEQAGAYWRESAAR